MTDVQISDSRWLHSGTPVGQEPVTVRQAYGEGTGCGRADRGPGIRQKGPLGAAVGEAMSAAKQAPNRSELSDRDLRASVL